MEAQPIRVLVVDDDASFLHSLEAVLTGEPGLEIVGKAASGEEALAAACGCRISGFAWKRALFGEAVAVERSFAGNRLRCPARCGLRARA